MKSSYELIFSHQAMKDIKTLSAKMNKKLRDIIINVIALNPLRGKRLMGELKGNFSYRLNLKDRIIYSIDEKNKKVYIKRARTHYGD